MWKSPLLISTVFVVFGCTVGFNKSVEQSSAPPVAAKTDQRPEISPPPDKYANYRATKFYDESRLAETVSLQTQPKEIVERVLGDDYRLAPDRAKETIVGIENRDLNNDGVAEKVLFEMTNGENSRTATAAYLFILEKEKWASLNPKYLYDNLDNTEYLSSGKSGEFDVIKVDDEIRGKDDTLVEGIMYIRVKNRRYSLYECFDR